MYDFSSYADAVLNIGCILGKERNMRCEFFIMDEKRLAETEQSNSARDNNRCRLSANEWYVAVECLNGYMYYINVTGDSVLAMCADILDFIRYK